MSLETLPPQAAPVNPRSALLSNVVALLRVLPRGGRPGALWRRIYRHSSIRGWGHLRARYAYVADGDTAVGPFIEVAVQVGVGRQFGGAGRKKGASQSSCPLTRPLSLIPKGLKPTTPDRTLWLQSAQKSRWVLGGRKRVISCPIRHLIPDNFSRTQSEADMQKVVALSCLGPD